MEKFLEKYHKLFFLVVAIFLLYPTFQKGYIFLLDWTVRPDVSLADIDWKINSVVTIIYYILASIFSFGIFQRIYLFAIIFFLGLAGFRLAKSTNNIFARYFAGIFLIFNPFIYARLIEQPGIALGSLFFFWFLIYFLEYLEEEGKSDKKILLSSIFAGLAIASFAHSVFFVAISIVIFLFFKYLKDKDWQSCLITFLIIFNIVIFLNYNWLFSFAAGNNNGAGGVQSFSISDAEAFRTKEIIGESVYPTVLALQGYWGEYEDRFVSITENPTWFLAFLLIFLLSIFGFLKLWKSNIFAKSLLILFAIAYVLAVGVASPIFKPLALFLYEHVPLYIGLREPQKWVVVLVFVYAYFGSWGIKFLWDTKKLEGYRLEIGILAILLPIIFSFSMIKGMHEHFAPHEFPVEWQEAKAYLDNNSSANKILFLPWHLYMEFNFAGKNVVTPAKGFFGKNIIQGNNTETGKVYSHSLDPQTLTIEKYVLKKGSGDEENYYASFSEDMKKMGIQTVMLAKTEDWHDYAWLDRINVQKVLENNKLIIYKIL